MYIYIYMYIICEYIYICIGILSIYIYTYLDLLYGTYFCRCSKTLELSPFSRKNAVPENKCRCEKLSAHVVGYFRGLVGYVRRLVGHFRHWKTGLAIHIRRNSAWPKKVVLLQNLFIGQKAEIKPTLEEAGIYIHIYIYTHNYLILSVYTVYIYLGSINITIFAGLTNSNFSCFRPPPGVPSSPGLVPQSHRAWAHDQLPHPKSGPPSKDMGWSKNLRGNSAGNHVSLPVRFVSNMR